MQNAKTKSLTHFWGTLPEELKAKLRLGFTGKRHLLDIVGWSLRSGIPSLGPLISDALQTAFSENPLDGEMATELLAHEALRARLPKTTADAMNSVASHWRKPENTSYFERLLMKRDMAKLKNFIEQKKEREPENLFWREQAVTFGLIDNDREWVRFMLENIPAELTPILDHVALRMNLLPEAPVASIPSTWKTHDIFGPNSSAVTWGLHLLQSGEPTVAQPLLTGSLNRTPWNTSLILRLHDLITKRDTQKMPLDGSTAILLYSWNKAGELDATLASLFASDLPMVSIFALNNGSTDDTAEILEAWRPRFTTKLGPKRFEILSLPVNIGAPAARNWLMHHPPVTAHDFTCYLDDDVALPSDWLARLGSAVHLYPEAGVWGCKVTDYANMALVQSADSHLLGDQDAPPLDLSRTAPNPFRLSDLHIQTLDAGLLDIMRPCASVTGCCHLFRTAVLLESGDFALQLSPSQYDDMEHDLRLCKTGQFPVYQGHLSIRHKKRTGVASRTSAKEEGNALGNKYKMQTMHSREELTQAMLHEHRLLDDDLMMKMARLDQTD